MKYSTFEKNIAQSLNNLEIPVDADALLKSIGVVDKKKNKKPLFWVALPILFLGGLALGVYIQGHKASNSIPKPSKIQYNLQATQSNLQPTSLVEKQELKENLEAIAKDDKDNAASFLPKSQHNIAKHLDRSEKDKNIPPSALPTFISSIQNQALDVTSSELDNTSLTEDKTFLGLPIQPSTIEEIQPKYLRTAIQNLSKVGPLYVKVENTSAALYSITSKIECPDFSVNKNRMRLELIPEVGLFYPNKNTKAPSIEPNTVVDQRMNNEKSREGWQLGLHAKLKHERFPIYLKPGATYSRITERLDYKYEYTERDTAVGIISITKSPNGDTITVIYGDIITESLIKGQKRRHYFINTVDLPIQLGYEKVFGGWAVGIEGGPVFNLTTFTRGNVLNGINTFADPQKSPLFKSKLGLSYQVGLSLGYSVGTHSTIYISTRGRFIPTAFNTAINPISQKYNWLGLNLGYGFKF